MERSHARTRRLPFQQKIGSGLNKEQFAQKVKDGSVRHVGLAESVQMIADSMGWKLDKVTVRAKTGSAEVYGKQSTGWVASYTEDYVVVMMISQAGTCLGFLMLAWSHSLWMVFIGRIVVRLRDAEALRQSAALIAEYDVGVIPFKVGGFPAPSCLGSCFMRFCDFTTHRLVFRVGWVKALTAPTILRGRLGELWSGGTGWLSELHRLSWLYWGFLNLPTATESLTWSCRRNSCLLGCTGR